MKISKSSSLIFPFLLSFYMVAIDGVLIDFYEDTGHSGYVWQVDVSPNCNPLPDWVQYQVSSINTHGACVRYYNGGCNGGFVDFYPGSPNHDDFNALGINDVYASVQICPR